MQNLTTYYNGPARFFHWLTVALLAIQYTVGWLMPDVHRGMQPIGLISWHLSIGSVIIMLVLLRLVWHWITPAPLALQTISPLLQKFAHVTHSLLYFLLLAFPLMGWVNASVRGWPLTIFGLIPLPPLVPKGSVLGKEFGELHSPFAWVLIAVIALHVVGALYHHFIVKDQTLSRMLPGR